MSVLDDIKTALQGLTYTKRDGSTASVNVFNEDDVITARKLDFPTPAFIIRDSLTLDTPGVGMGERRIDVTVSLYLTARAQDYDPTAVREELTTAIYEAIKTAEIGDSAWVAEHRDLDWLERAGVMRRDFTIAVFIIA